MEENFWKIMKVVVHILSIQNLCKKPKPGIQHEYHPTLASSPLMNEGTYTLWPSSLGKPMKYPLVPLSLSRPIDLTTMIFSYIHTWRRPMCVIMRLNFSMLMKLYKSLIIVPTQGAPKKMVSPSHKYVGWSILVLMGMSNYSCLGKGRWLWWLQCITINTSLLEKIYTPLPIR